MSNPVGAQRYGLGGGDAYYDAVKYGGYTGTREQFGRDQAEFAQNATAVAQAKEEVERNTQTVVNTAQTFTEETVPAAIQSVEEKGDTEEDRLEARTTELVEAVNTAGAVQVQAVEDEGTTQLGLVSGAGTTQVQAVNDAGTTQVGAVNQAGEDQIDAVEQAGADQVQAVTDEGTTQVTAVEDAGAAERTAIEEKGEQTRETIPDDYTTLSDNVDNLKSAISERTINLFDSTHLTEATGWAFDGEEYYGTVFNINVKWDSASNVYPNDGFEAATQYTISFDTKTLGNQGTNGNGLRFNFAYSDNTNSSVTVLNATTTYTHFTATSTAGKTVVGIYFGYGSNGNNIWYLKNIMLSKGVVDVAYTPYLTALDFIARKNITKIQTDLTQAENDIVAIESRFPLPKIPVSAPTGFSWSNNLLKDKIYTDYDGEYFIDFDVSSLDVAETGTIYYVDYDNGADTNTGLTPYDPLKKIATAYGKADCSCIILANGIYADGFNLKSTTITKDISIKAAEGANPIICTHSATNAFSVYSGTTYSTSRGSNANVIDMKYQNAYGDFIEYQKLSTAAEVVDTAGTWAHVSGTLYVHCIDDREPDADLLFLIASNNIYAEGNPTIYLEGLTLLGGNAPLRVANTALATDPKVYAKNCRFLHSASTSYDCVMLEGTELSIMQNCRAMYGQKDGFNYHAKNGVVPKAIEINCIGAMNGNSDDNNDQGSTIHDGGSAIRIKGSYFGNYGSNVAEESAESWNIGCVAFEPKAPNDGQKANFYAYTGTSMWMDSCIMFGGAHYNVIAANDGTTAIYLRNNKIDVGSNVPVYGTTPTYY